ncbi:cobalamin biosynthesis protein [Nocardia sp. 2YAB30]|uniref:cobalamin biosynthesis protein n=1 Tax=unclassified Nocardia TaxID=2637762 RepID=UPI003F994DAD
MPSAELVVGIGFRPRTSADRIRAALREVLGDKVIGYLATLEQRATDSGLRMVAAELGVPIRSYSAADLAMVDVPNPASRTLEAVATASVAEAAAVLGADGGPLVVRKRVVQGVVIAAARLGHPR